MSPDDRSSLQTRPSLLNRLKTGDDAASWEHFYQIYGKLARDFAIRAGLSDTEADDAVQETMLGISRNLRNYKYNPKICRFKTWLLNQTSWRIKDQLRKRKKEAAWSNAGSGSGRARGSFSPGDDTTLAAAINRVPDPASVDVGAKVEEQWRMSLFEMALERVKEKFSLKQFQIFDLLAVKEWPAAEVARALGVTATNAYVTRHRISAAIKKETKRIEQQLEQAAGSSRKK